jgi:hypothetical protein
MVEFIGRWKFLTAVSVSNEMSILRLNGSERVGGVMQYGPRRGGNTEWGVM